jgi:homoserine kinase type II
VRQPERGTNNLVWIIHTAVDGGARRGGAYVLRIHQNAAGPQVAAEHRLLAALAERTNLSYDVPVPLPSRDGRTVVTTPHGLASLTPSIPGDHPRGDLRELELAGAALGELDNALAALPEELAPFDWGSRTLGEIHPRVRSAAELAAELVSLLPDEPAVTWFAERAAQIEAETVPLSAASSTGCATGRRSTGSPASSPCRGDRAPAAAHRPSASPS